MNSGLLWGKEVFVAHYSTSASPLSGLSLFLYNAVSWSCSDRIIMMQIVFNSNLTTWGQFFKKIKDQNGFGKSHVLLSGIR